jgi:hypothetical protein
MPCHAMHTIQDLFLESFSYELQFDMHFYMHSYLHKKNYSCKKWVLHASRPVQWLQLVTNSSNLVVAKVRRVSRFVGKNPSYGVHYL